MQTWATFLDRGQSEASIPTGSGPVRQDCCAYPTGAIRDQIGDELLQLEAEIEYLSSENAAVPPRAICFLAPQIRRGAYLLARPNVCQFVCQRSESGSNRRQLDSTGLVSKSVQGNVQHNTGERGQIQQLRLLIRRSWVGFPLGALVVHGAAFTTPELLAE